MPDRFDAWQYRDDANCWDFVREFLHDKAHVPLEELPKYGIAPSDKTGMTQAALPLYQRFIPCDPLTFAIACHYRGELLLHVGVVIGDCVRHTGKHLRPNTQRTPIKVFERWATTRYFLHRSLWPN